MFLWPGLDSIVNSHGQLSSQPINSRKTARQSSGPAIRCQDRLFSRVGSWQIPAPNSVQQQLGHLPRVAQNRYIFCLASVFPIGLRGAGTPVPGSILQLSWLVALGLLQAVGGWTDIPRHHLDGFVALHVA